MESNVQKEERLLSIIIPVFNAERYISLCLDSLLEQDLPFSCYEIICINDGSTDSSLSVIRRYAQQYDNIVVIDKSNSGVSATRNLGLEKAEGKYIWFVDSDDWVARNCLGTLAKCITELKPSAILIEHCEVLENDCALYEKKLFNKSDCQIVLDVPFYVSAVCQAVVEKDLIERYSLRFMEHISYGEDSLFMRDILDQTTLENEKQEKKHLIVALKSALAYFYRQHSTSAVHSVWTTKRHSYMESLLSQAALYRQRSLMPDMPKWYTKRYEKLFIFRIMEYMLVYLPGSGLDIDETLRKMKDDGFYPLKTPHINKQIPGKRGFKRNLIKWYRLMAFKHPALYRLYFKQMEKRYAGYNAE